MDLLQQAIWKDRTTITIPPSVALEKRGAELVYSADAAAISLEPTSKQGEFQLPAEIDFATVLKGQLEVRCGAYSTGVQMAGVLDHLFYFDGKLGPQFPDHPDSNIRISVWAPTAQSVKLLLFYGANDDAPAHVLSMLEAGGVWSVEIENTWRNGYYLFRVKVFVPKLKAVVENLVTDPYSVDLALNGAKSRITNLNHPDTKPDYWDNDQPPKLKSLHDLSIWEVHVRDFSANDFSVQAERRGTYLAFTNADSNGMRHLRRLADAGIKAIHLLPTFHIASVNEDKTMWKTAGDLTRYAADGTQQQEVIGAIQQEDAYNWGYDPVHYLSPEGSYAVNVDNRVKEYRAMVQALHQAGLCVIQDQVFNHTSASGQAANSVLDKIVPDYYYRLDADGKVMNATCCSDTASEHRMMEKLMVDSVTHSFRHYKIDGFRFDLMGFHYLPNMRRLQAAVGESTYLYGEGWECKETENHPDMLNATQANLTGTGIGTFNGGMRDAIRGGNPFSDVRVQGFATGASADVSCGQRIRAGLRGSPGYTANPIECVNYCSAHDNQTLFDAIQLKVPITENMATRVRRQVLALSLIALAQGIPFFHAGDEILRSKDMDNNSYNSGDWFNKLDFTYQCNNWGTGLPMASENQSNWHIMQPLLANPRLKPGVADILRTRKSFEALLRVRSSSGLFGMRTMAEINRNLRFVKAEPGVVAMLLNSRVGSYQGYQKILVVFNGRTKPATVKGPRLKPHPEMKKCGRYDAGVFKVPGLTTGVFVD